MRDRLLSLTGGVVRLALVVVAFGLALGSVGIAGVRGFCPDVDTAAGGTVVAAAVQPLATVVEPEDDTLEQEPAGDDTVPAEDTGDDGTLPAEGDAEGDGEQPAQADECPGGVDRCLPPLLSSVLLVGDPACNDQAGAELRSVLVPAFVGSTVLLAVAWGLRPGGRVLSALQR